MTVNKFAKDFIKQNFSECCQGKLNLALKWPRVRWYWIQLSIKCSKTITCILVGISLQSHVKSWGQENPFKWFGKIRHFCHYQLEFYMFTLFTPFCWFMPTYESTTAVIIIWQFLMFYQILLSPQVKQSKITSNKYGIWELPHELPNDLRLRKYLENLKFHRIIVFQNKNFVNTSKKLVKNRSWNFPAVHYFTRKLQPASISRPWMQYPPSPRPPWKSPTAPDAMIKTTAARITPNANRIVTHQTTMVAKMIYAIMHLMCLVARKTWKWSSINDWCLKYVSFSFKLSHVFFTFCWFANIYKLKMFKNLPFTKISTCEIQLF